MDPTETRREPEKRNRKYYDYTMLFMVIALIVIGILMIGSISAYNAAKYERNATKYTDSQIVFAAVGVVAMIIISLIDYRIYAIETPRRKWPIFIALGYLFIVGALAAVIVIGRSNTELSGATNGAARWIAVGGIKIQPGEFAKLFMIIIASYWLCRIVAGQHRVRDTVIFLIGISVIAVLALVESMTTAIVLFGIVGGLLFVCSKKKLFFVILVAAGLLGAILIVRYVKTQDTSSGNFRMRRVYEWIHLEDKENEGQIKQGLYALASGGFLGKGIGQSAQKLGHIPEVHTDMIFAVIVEEMGLLGGAAILVLFGVLLWRIAIIAINAQELYGTLLCYGVMLHIGLQVCINVAVVTGTIPSTGVTLPFISYGGSSLIVLCIECGLVLNVSRNIGERRKVEIFEYSGPTGAKRRTDTISGERTRGGFIAVKNEPTGRKKPKRRLLGMFGSGKSGEGKPASRKSGAAKSGRKSGLRAEEILRRRSDSIETAETPAPATAQSKADNTGTQPGKYSMDVVLGQPARKNTDE